MRNTKITENGTEFNRSVKSEFVVVYKDKQIIYFGSGGITGTKKDMFVGTKNECLKYIKDNELLEIEVE